MSVNWTGISVEVYFQMFSGIKLEHHTFGYQIFSGSLKVKIKT